MAVSKTFNLAGLMIATIVIPDAALRAAWKAHHYPFINPLSLAAAVGAYEDGEPWLEALRGYLDGNFDYLKSFLTQHLPKAGFIVPEATYLVWIDLGAYFDGSVNLTRFFLEKAGVILEGGEMFVENGAQQIRLNLACPRSQVEAAATAIGKAVMAHAAK